MLTNHETHYGVGKELAAAQKVPRSLANQQLEAISHEVEGADEEVEEAKDCQHFGSCPDIDLPSLLFMFCSFASHLEGRVNLTSHMRHVAHSLLN